MSRWELDPPVSDTSVTGAAKVVTMGRYDDAHPPLEVTELGWLSEDDRSALSTVLGCSFTDEDRPRVHGPVPWLVHVAVDASGRGRLVVVQNGGRKDLGVLARSLVTGDGAGPRWRQLVDRALDAVMGP